MERRLTFYPLFEKSLNIAVKAVIAGDSTPDSYLGEYNEKWAQPSEEDGTPETHLSLKGETTAEGVVLFRIPKTNLSRLTLHFWRTRENNAFPRMACCRNLDRNPETGEIEKGKPFGFCFNENPKKQSFVNLVFLNASASKPKAPGFEPLYTKIEAAGQTTYLEIQAQMKDGTFIVSAVLTLPSKAPENLQTLSFEKIRKENPALNALRQRLLKR